MDRNGIQAIASTPEPMAERHPPLCPLHLMPPSTVAAHRSSSGRCRLTVRLLPLWCPMSVQGNPMERRSSPRRPIHLRATLSLGEFKPQTCVISDYCPGGLFLQYGVSLTQSLARQPGSVAGSDGVVSFQDPTDKQEYRLAIKVARLLEGAMGVMLTAPQEAALAAMERIARLEESRQATLVQNNSNNSILRQCTAVIQAFLKPLFEQFSLELGPSLVQAADQAANDAQSTE